MKFIIAAAVAAVCAAPAAALAEDAVPTGVYASAGYAAAHSSGIDLGAIQGRLGYRFNNWLGVEGELGFGVKDDKSTQVVNGTSVDTKVKLNDQEAIYGVGFLPLNANFDLLARVGYGHQGAKVSASAANGGGPVSVSDNVGGDSWNYGVGAQYHFDGKNGVRGDYTHESFTDHGAGHADVWAIAYTHRF